MWLQLPPRFQQLHHALLAAQAPDEQADHTIERKIVLAPEALALARLGGTKVRHVDGVREIPDALSWHAAGQRLALDVAGNAREGVRTAIQRADRSLHRAGDGSGGADPGLSQQRIDVVSRQDPGCLRLKDHRPTGDSTREQRRDAGRAVVHTADDIVVGGVAHQPIDDGRRHQPFAERRSLAVGPDAMDGDAAAILLVGQIPSNALGQHLHRHALGHQVMRQPLGVALHAADDRVEVRRQDEDAFHHRASTVCRRRLQ